MQFKTAGAAASSTSVEAALKGKPLEEMARMRSELAVPLWKRMQIEIARLESTGNALPTSKLGKAIHFASNAVWCNRIVRVSTAQRRRLKV